MKGIQSAPYFCPVCKQDGQKSIVVIGGSTATLMGVHRFFDERGHYHYHDPNQIQTSYSCSRGHSWVITHFNTCPAAGCDQSFKNDLRDMSRETVTIQ